MRRALAPVMASSMVQSYETVGVDARDGECYSVLFRGIGYVDAVLILYLRDPRTSQSPAHLKARHRTVVPNELPRARGIQIREEKITGWDCRQPNGLSYATSVRYK